jgi:hypothetical protein
MREDSVKAQDQKTLEDFLRLDTDTASTLLKTAAIDADSDPAQSKAALDKARAAPDIIRRLAVRIDDAATRAQIESRSDELEVAIRQAAH